MKSKRNLYTIFVLAVFLTVSPKTTIAQTNTSFDILIVNGMVLDGTGNPWFAADIGISDGKIVAVEKFNGTATADKVIDAKGKTIIPGIIDIHSHAYDVFRRTNQVRDEAKIRAAPNMVAQGVTTLVTNHDGRGPESIAQQIEMMKRNGGTGPNVIFLIGHGTVRRAAMGNDFQRVATPEEIEEQKRLVRVGMDEGAWGMSAGLEYVPGRWSNTDEVAEVVSALKPYNGVFIEHERGSGHDPMWYYPSQHEPGQPGIIASVIESIEIAERTGVRVVATHIKARGAQFWGGSRTVVRLINDARSRGVDIFADHYPYNTSGSDGSTTLIPPWARSRNNTQANVENIIQDPEKNADLRMDINHEIMRRGGPENIVVMDYPDKSLVGKSLRDIANQFNISPIDAALKLQKEGMPSRPGGAHLRGFSMSEIDLEIYAAEPWVATATDGDISLPGRGLVHARWYGTFPRKIRHYAMNRGVITVEHAVRSMTSLPAQILGLKNRGTIREGNMADIVIMDMKTIKDTATFFEPHQYPEGIEQVMVGGKMLVENGELTWQLHGKILTPKDY